MNPVLFALVDAVWDAALHENAVSCIDYEDCSMCLDYTPRLGWWRSTWGGQ